MTDRDNKLKVVQGGFADLKYNSDKSSDSSLQDNNLSKRDKPQNSDSKKKNRNKAHTDEKPLSPANIGWLYYKDYYYGIPFRCVQKEDELKPLFEAKNQVIKARQLSQYREEVEILQAGFEPMQWFEMTTVYPGLVTGLGASHETHREGEYKLGFYFDHTTGLPIIPGSSVKGVLRSAFKKSPEYIEYLLENPLGDNAPITGIDIDKLEKEIFDGEGLSPYRRDVFLDAVIVSSKNKDTLFLADDFITPHGEDVFKDPIPLQFLKILPQVTFRFQFRLNNGLISIESKTILFKLILTDIGIGAKTNVGYGKFKTEPIPKL